MYFINKVIFEDPCRIRHYVQLMKMLCHGTMQRVCHKYLKTMLSAIQWYYLNSV